jgi:3',5'-nucleoside bisphosphate phosphatase
MMWAMRVDLHTHSSVSDGTDSPSVLVRHAAAAGLDVMALADHDTFDGLDEAQDEGNRVGVLVIPALEMSCELDGASIHLLGYAPDVADVALSAELARIRTARAARVPGMIDKLAGLGFPLTAEEVVARTGAASSIGRPHIADALVARGYFPSRDAVFADLLYDGGPAYVERDATPLARGIGLLAAAGGVPVIAHPWGRGSRRFLTPDAFSSLAGVGLMGVEVDHTDHDASVREELRALASDLGLVATGGSDHHGRGRPANPLGVCVTDPRQWERLCGCLRPLW